jgi:hypothetical protein
MTSALFAVVDMMLADALREARRHARSSTARHDWDIYERAKDRVFDLRRLIGWWRSTW